MSADAAFAIVSVFLIFAAFAVALCRSAAAGDQMARRASRERFQEQRAANSLRPRTGVVSPAPSTKRGSGASTPSRLTNDQ